MIRGQPQLLHYSGGPDSCPTSTGPAVQATYVIIPSTGPHLTRLMATEKTMAVHLINTTTTINYHILGTEVVPTITLSAI